MQRETAQKSRRSRSLVIVFLALAIVAVFGIAAQQALAISSYQHGGAVCASCHGTPFTPTNDKCTACHTGGYAAPIANQTCWTCHTPGQDMSLVKTGAPVTCTLVCHLANGTTNKHVAHTVPGRTACTTCHNLTTSSTAPNSSPHHMLGSAPVKTTVTLKASPAAIKLKASVKGSGKVTPLGLGSVVSMTAQMKKAGVPANVQDDVLAQNEASQIDGLRAALSVLAVMGVISLFFTGRIPRRPPGSEPAPA
jgi:hypothetical protein